MTTIGSENVTYGPGKPERFGGKYRGARRDTVLTEVASADLNDDDAQDELRPNGGPGGPSLSLPGMEPLTEPSFPAAGWQTGITGSLVDHPLMRGLLMELPPKGSLPPSEWLDLWFEATRSILELLYVQRPGPAR